MAPFYRLRLLVHRSNQTNKNQIAAHFAGMAIDEAIGYVHLFLADHCCPLLPSDDHTLMQLNKLLDHLSAIQHSRVNPSITYRFNMKLPQIFPRNHS